MLTAKKLYGFEPDYAVSPGETLKEVMESLNMAQKERATGVPARMWNNLEAQYREQLGRLKNGNYESKKEI